MKEEKDLEKKHIPVLLNELVEWITINKNKKNIVVDCTLWLWWHALEILKKMNSWDIFIWFDADIYNLKLAKQKLKQHNNNINPKIDIILINSNFVNIKEELDNIWIQKISWIYYDLWMSSVHIDQAKRWFSFMQDWPLDMRFDKNKWKTAEIIVNSYKQNELRRIFFKYSQEAKSNKIAEKILEKRKEKRIKTTLQLSDVIEKITKNIKTKARIFQALRIETNNELENLEKSLSDAIDLLEKDWIIFVISFHSLEDRITKQIFKKETRDCICSDFICSCKHTKRLKLLTKKPIQPTKEEVKYNSRSKSAKVRIAKKV